MTQLPEFTEGYREGVKYDADELARSSPDEGLHNINLRNLFERSYTGNSYRNRSTMMVVPAVSNPLCKDTDGRDIIPVPPKVVSSWLRLQTPTNSAFSRILVENCEVGDAYNQAVRIILDDPGLREWTWLLTTEVDNIPPPDGLLQLLEDVETVCNCTHILRRHDQSLQSIPCMLCQCTTYKHGVEYDAIGGIYFAKQPSGFPMAFGKVDEIPRNYRPWIPPPDSVSECCALGMGFTLFKIDMFKHMNPPWFRTIQEWIPGIGERLKTQDLSFWADASKHGYRCAISTNVRVGHIDPNGVIWSLLTPLVVSVGLFSGLHNLLPTLFNLVM